MANSARDDSSMGSELEAVKEACREASRTVEPCILYSTILAEGLWACLCGYSYFGQRARLKRE